LSQDHPILPFEAALVEAQLTGDVAALDRLLDDELYFTGLGGRVFSKADDLSAHRSGQLRITKMLPVERHIASLGSVAVVSVLMDAVAMVAGVTNAGMLRYTRIWRQTPDGWKVVAGHMSAVEGANT
jgi:ketosteroid isomerase-like protein